MIVGSTIWTSKAELAVFFHPYDEEELAAYLLQDQETLKFLEQNQDSIAQGLFTCIL